MFATFKYNETTKDHEYISRSSHPSSADDKEYTRTACDLCRARKLRCSGDNEGCDRCLSTSSPCTYTLSSGIGAGKKRLRKVPATASFRCAKKHPSPSPSRSRSRFQSAGVMHHNRLTSEGRRNEDQLRASLSPIATHAVENSLSNPSTDFTSCAPEHPGFLPSPDSWSHLGMDVDALLHARTDSSDSFLANDGFISMCPSKPNAYRGASQIPTPMTDQDPVLSTGKEAGVDDRSFMELLELSKSPDHADSPPRIAQARQTSASPPNAASTSVTRPRSRTRDHGISAYSSSPTSSEQCQCLSSMLRTLEDLGSQTTANATGTSTDDLFQCLELGIEKCHSTLSCNACRTITSSPVLVVTIVNQLVIVVAELVDRFIMCQSPDTVPTVFQFGRYCVAQPALRTRLLKSMIELYVKDLQSIIVRLGTMMGGRQGPSLEEAKTKSEEVHQKLRDFASSDAMGNA